MKVPYKHFIEHIESSVDIAELSEKLFQLGHEHEISNKIFDMELTPNRGDCLSLNGLLRDLKVCFDISFTNSVFDKEIRTFPFKFINNSNNACKRISFLKIEIDEVPLKYNKLLENYFSDLNIKKINFFTDISNYISYETGQPTHCYDFSCVNEPIKLNFLQKDCEFNTLLDKNILIKKGDLVFCDKDDNVINLAGIVGGKNTACKDNTKSVIVECASFDPEVILGKSIKYDINSDAAHKFERYVDPLCHDFVLRRFLQIVGEHCNIKNVELFKEVSKEEDKNLIEFDHNKINEILGTEIDHTKCISYLKKLGFNIKDDLLEIPSYRNDISTLNDIAEEVARAIGYDNITKQSIDITFTNKSEINNVEHKIKKILINEGFYEVINNPFVKENTEESVIIDNPLDSNRNYLRTNLKATLVNNLLYNERRQKETIKLFEITDLYSNKLRTGKRVIGIIASGRVDKNYEDFSKKINDQYLKQIIERLNISQIEIQEISRDSLESKSKNPIFYSEIEIDSNLNIDHSYDSLNINDISNKVYNPISEFPSSKRDLSFSIKDFSKCKELEKFILEFEDKLLKETYVFDYYKNEKTNEIKIGFRFIFQSNSSTITDKEVDNVMNMIIDDALKDSSITIPGLI